MDALVYAVAVTGTAFVLGSVLSFSLGRDLTGVKYLLFFAGLLLFGYSTLQLRPKPPWNVEKTSDGTVEIVRNEERGESIGSREETRFQAAIQRVPPLAWYSIPPEERLSPAVKLFVASLAVLAASYLMEVVLGVGG